MPGCTVVREAREGWVVLKVSGMFDGASAWELRDALSGERGRDVVVDFSQVREFYDLGVSVLAQGLRREGRHLFIRGLRQHQLRMFRYLGVEVDPIDAGPEGPASVAAPFDPKTVAYL
jgi:anti-anti-sigma regulatory factor